MVGSSVDLDPQGRPGLGADLHTHLNVPVVGVATAFRTASHANRVRRGNARRPLHVTAAGISAERAAAFAARMAGPYRLPDALRRVDALARSKTASRQLTPQRHSEPVRAHAAGRAQQFRWPRHSWRTTEPWPRFRPYVANERAFTAGSAGIVVPFR